MEQISLFADQERVARERNGREFMRWVRRLRAWRRMQLYRRFMGLTPPPPLVEWGKG